jgi:hypothetical protein
MAQRELNKKTDTQEDKEAKKELEELFEVFGDGTITVKVNRVDPPHGYCGDFFVTKGNPLSLRELKRRFGGRVLQLVGRSADGSFRKQTTISICDVPRVEGMEVYADGTIEKPNKDGGQQQQQQRTEKSPFESIVDAPIPWDVKKKILPYMFGYAPEPDKKEDPRAQSQFEMMQQQMMFDMMNTARQNQMDMMRQTMELQRDMSKQRREMDDAYKPKDALSEVDTVIKLMRELNGFKSEFGGDGKENWAATLMANGMPMIENVFAEFLSLKKLQLQGELNAAKKLPGGPPPCLPPRETAAPVRGALRVVDASENDPIEMARQAGALYRRYATDEEMQQQMIDAFLHGNQNIEPTSNNDTIETDDDDFLDEEDQALLDADNDKNEGCEIQNGEYAAPIDADDQADRKDNTGRIDGSEN